MILEKTFEKESPFAFLVNSTQKVQSIKIEKFYKLEVTTILENIKKMLCKGLKPYSSASNSQCSICEYLNYCNDRF